MSKFLHTILLTLLVVLSFFFSFYKLSYPDIKKWDESTNALVANETLQNNSPLLLQFEGKPFLEKPSFFYQLTMLSIMLFGFNEFGLRFIPSLMGFLLILLTYFTTKTLFGQKAGLIAGFFLLTIPQLFIQNWKGEFSTHTFRSADSDSLLIFFMILSICAFFLWLKKSTWYLYVASTATALAVMTKGPIGCVPLLICFLVSAVLIKKLPLTKKNIFFSIAIFLLLTLPYHGYLLVVYQTEYLKTYIAYHLFQRVFTPLEGHSQPWWFYLKLLLEQSTFLTLILITSAFLFISHNRFFSYIHKVLKASTKTYLKTSIKNLLRKNPSLALFVTIITIFITLLTLITISQTKLAWYMLPTYPFLAMCVGYSLSTSVPKIPCGFFKTILTGTLSMLFLAGIFQNGFFLFNLPLGKIQSLMQTYALQCPDGFIFTTSDTSRDVEYVIKRYETKKPNVCSLNITKIHVNSNPEGYFIDIRKN